MTGTIKRLVVEKGFGFIGLDNGDKDVFFHSSTVQTPAVFDRLQLGDKVTFDVEQSDKGPRAINVTVA